jgi:hypothetical protein
LEDGSDLEELSDLFLVLDGDILEAFFNNLFVVFFVVCVLVVIGGFDLFEPVGRDFVHLEDFEVEVENAGLVLFVFQYGGDGFHGVVREFFFNRELHHVLHLFFHQSADASDFVMKLTHQGQGHILEQVFFLLLVGHFVDGFFEDFHETGVDSAEDQVFEVGVFRDGFGFFELGNSLREDVDILLEVVFVVFEEFGEAEVHLFHALDKEVLVLDDEVVELNEFGGELFGIGMAVELVVGVAVDWVFVQELGWEGLDFLDNRNELLDDFFFQTELELLVFF